METNKTKAFKMLSTIKSVKERAEKYTERIKKSIQLDVLNSLEEKIEKTEDKIFDLSNFALETDRNKDMKQLSKEDCENRFKSIINLKYEKALLELELKVKKEAFENLFGAES